MPARETKAKIVLDEAAREKLRVQNFSRFLDGQNSIFLTIDREPDPSQAGSIRDSATIGAVAISACQMSP